MGTGSRSVGRYARQPSRAARAPARGAATKRDARALGRRPHATLGLQRLAVGLLEDWARHTARAVTDLVDALDLDHVVFGGPLWPRLATTFLRVVPDVVRGRAVGAAIHPIAVTGTRLGPDGAAVGAASLVLDHTFSPRSATLLLAD